MQQVTKSNIDTSPQSIDIESRLSEITERLERLYPKSIDLSLERIERFLAEVGNPHHNLPPVIHVAGTNGKGSTLAYLRAIFETNENTFHATTSPHLISFNERIVIDGQNISTNELMSILDECDEVNAGSPITYFEIAIAATLLAFSRYDAEYTLLETGLGGRLDATNVVADPAVSIITSIGYDHMDYLGSSLKEIAFEKAGIFKDGRPCVVGPQTKKAMMEGVMDVFIDQAKQKNCPLYLAGRDWFVEETPFGFRLMYGNSIEDYPLPSLMGRHQIDNAATAIMALKAIEQEQDKKLFSRDTIAKGIESTVWAGRLQKLQNTRWNSYLSEGHELYLDGGHNENAASALAKQLKKWKREDKKSTHLVLGMMNRKDPVAFVKALKPYLKSVTCIPVEGGSASIDPNDLQKNLLKSLPNLEVYTAKSGETALKEISLKSDSNDRTLIAGSLYLAGQVLAEN